MTESEARRRINNNLYARTQRAELNIKGWNTYEVRCEGQKFTVKINGVVVNQVESRWSGPWRVGLNAKARGSARFRNVAIKGLSRTDPTVATRKIAIRTTRDPAQFQTMLSSFVPDIALSTRASGDGLAIVEGHLGRPRYLRTHPVDQNTPCILSGPGGRACEQTDETFS